ncbi:hypothetical protein FWF89_02795 [Candidatus Saccharibacteria bacterium]|nr:hypothetical protein [Candidatus Saccharibacteria bacterium]
MAATSTPSVNSLLDKLSLDYPNLIFRHGKKFLFRPPKTIFIGPPCPNHALLTLHELAHGLLQHKNYNLDIQRLKIESSTWQKTQELCKKYNIDWDEDFAQDHLDTYRDWLHKKSLCPTCQLTRYQDKTGTYHCPACQS